MHANVAVYHPIYLNAAETLWCVVDEIDYQWAREFRWNYKPGTEFLGHKYAKRNVGVERTPVYLHREIMFRVDPLTPVEQPRCRLTDHINGNTLDCRRQNLRWVTHSQNARNLGGRSFCVPLMDLSHRALPF